jgi:hypothetical protein
MKRVALVLVLLSACPVLAQESPSYKLAEHVFNAGGRPVDGTLASSASYRLTMEAIGDAAVGAGLQGPSYHADAGFGFCYPPPGEVRSLWFSDHDNLHWDPERSVGDYALYRDLMSHLSGGGYGSCEQHGLTLASTKDSSSPPADDGFFYLVTARNRLREEGTKGRDSDGLERANTAPCP